MTEEKIMTDSHPLDMPTEGASLDVFAIELPPAALEHGPAGFATKSTFACIFSVGTCAGSASTAFCYS